MTDFNTGTLKGSIQIDFGSVRKAEQAVKSLQGQFSGYVKASNTAAQSAQNYTKAATQQAKATRAQTVAQERILKGYTQLEQAEKQLLVLKRQSAAETHEGNLALKNATASVNSYRATLRNTNTTTLKLTESYENMQQQLIRASVATTGLNQSTANARSWFRSSRAAASQFGLQLQDVAVQAQMGTNWLIILGQQGSQLLGFFGAAGAAAGAFLAIGAALVYVASSSKVAKDSTEALDKTVTMLDKSFTEAADGSNVLSEEILNLAKVSQAAATVELQRQLAESAVAGQRAATAIGSLAEQSISNFRDAAEEYAAVGGQMDAVTGAGSNMETTLREVSDTLGVNRGRIEQLFDAYNEINKAPTVENFQNLSEVLSAVGRSTDRNNLVWNTFSAELNNVAVQAVQAIRRGEEIEDVLADLPNALKLAREELDKTGRSTKTAAEEAAEYIAKLREEAETLGMSRQQLVSYEIAKIAAKDATIQNKEALIAEAQAYVESINQREKLTKRLEALEGRRGDPLAQAKKEAQARKRFIEQSTGQFGQTEQQAATFSAAFESNPEMLRQVEEWRRRQQSMLQMQAGEVSSSPFGSLESLEMELAQREQILIDYFGREKAMTTNHWEELQQNAQNSKIFLGIMRQAQAAESVLGSSLSAMSAMGREQTREFQILALAQTAISQAMAVAQAFDDPEVPTWAKYGLAASAGAAVGAQIAAIKSVNYATGGLVRGPGTGTSDSVPANLSNGEFVMRADAVRQIGINNLNAMNQGRMANFANGGMVGGTTTVGGSTTVNVFDQRSGGAPVETRETTDENGNRNIEILVRDIVNNGMIKGDFDRTMGASFGVRRQGRRV